MSNSNGWSREDLVRRRLKVIIAQEIFQKDINDPRLVAAVRARRWGPGPEELYEWELDQLLRHARQQAKLAMDVRDILAGAPRVDD